MTGLPLLPPSGKTDFSNEPVVVELSSSVYQYNADGTGDRTLRATLHLQSEAAVREFGVLTFPFAAEDERVEIRYLRVRKGDGSTVATALSDAQDLPSEVTRQAPLYSDQHQLQIPVRSLAVGDRLEYEVVVHELKAEAPGEFWQALSFDQNNVTLDEEFELRFPSDKRVTILSADFKPEIRKESGVTVYHWQSKNLRATVAPPGGKAPDESDKPKPKTIPDVAWTTFPDWAAVGTWYRTLSGDRAAPNEALRAKAAALTAGATSDEEKLDRIYKFVSMQIRYVGVDFGVGRFQPHAAADVLASGYGDCKDKHTLLAALLAAEGFRVEPVLIGANIKIDKDLPAPNSFNHVITAVELSNGKRLWLDSTAEVAPPGMLVAPIRDEDALLIPPAPAVPTLVKTPADLPFPSFDTYTARGTLSPEGKLTAHFDVTMRGDLELMMRAGLFASGRGQWEQIGQSLSSMLGFGGTVSAFSSTDVDTPEKPLTLSYDYTREGYGNWPSQTVPMLPPGLFSRATFDKQPDDPIALGAARVENGTSTLTLPEGYTIPALPKDLHLSTSFARFDLTYKLTGRELLTTSRLELTKSTLPPAKWQEYNEFASELNQTETFLSLEAHAGGTPASATSPETARVAASPGAHAAGNAAAGDAAAGAPPNASVHLDTEAGALLEEAYRALQTAKIPEAQEKLAAARAINPDQPGTWLMASEIAAAQKHYDEAEVDVRKELAVQPDRAEQFLPLLLRDQLAQKHTADAITTLEKLRALKPDDAAFTRSEASLLTSEGKHEEAISMLERAALHNPSDKWTVLALGTAQLAAGRSEEAKSTFELTLENTEDPLILNDAAYELANHGLDLPLAETDAGKALTILDRETSAVSLSTLTQKELAQQSMLGATWDTRGWIEYLQGNSTVAESYLRAAWVLSERAEMGYHLGMLLEKEGKRTEALAVYTAAEQALPQGSTETFAADLRKHKADLAPGGPAGQVRDGGSKSPGSGPGFALGSGAAELSSLRTLQLPLLVKEHREAEFFVLASAGSIEAVRYASGDATLTSQSGAIQAALARDRATLPMPSGSAAKLVRRGVLSCSPLIKACQFTFYLPQDTFAPKPPPKSTATQEASTASR